MSQKFVAVDPASMFNVCNRDRQLTSISLIVALKKKWASGLCFGGTMIWSVDFDASNGR